MRLQSRQRTQRQKVELFVEGLSCNFAEMTDSSPFMSMFLATNLRQVIDNDIEVMLRLRFHNMSCDKSLSMFDIRIIETTIDLVIWIEPTEQIRVLAFQLQSNFA